MIYLAVGCAVAFVVFVLWILCAMAGREEDQRLRDESQYWGNRE